MSPERQRPIFGEKLKPRERRQRPQRGPWSFLTDTLETIDRLIIKRKEAEVEGKRSPSWVWFWTPQAEKGITYRSLTEITRSFPELEWTPIREEKMKEGKESERILRQQFSPLSIASNIHLVDEETRTKTILDGLIRVWTQDENFVPAVLDYKSVSHKRFLELTEKQTDFPNLPYPELLGPYCHPFPEDADQVQGGIYILKKCLGVKSQVGIVVYRDRDTLDKFYGLVSYHENKARNILGLEPDPQAIDLPFTKEFIQGLKELPELVVEIQEVKHEAEEKGLAYPLWTQFYTPLGRKEEKVYPRASEISKCPLMATFSTFPQEIYRRLPKNEQAERILGAGSSADWRLKGEFNPLGISGISFFSPKFRARGTLDTLIRAYKTEKEFEWVDVSFKEIGSGQFNGLGRKGMPERHLSLPDLDTWYPFINPREEDAIQEQLYMAFLNELGVKIRFSLITYENRDQPQLRKFALVEYNPRLVEGIMKIQNSLLSLTRGKSIQTLYEKEKILLNFRVPLNQTIYQEFSEENETQIVPIPGPGSYIHFICDYCVECPHPEGKFAARKRLKDPKYRLLARKYQRLEKALEQAAGGKAPRKRKPGILTRYGVRRTFQEISDLVPKPSPTVTRRSKPEEFQIPLIFEPQEKKE